MRPRRPKQYCLQLDIALWRSRGKSKHTMQRLAVATQSCTPVGDLLRMFFEQPFMIISFSSRHRAQFRFPFLLAGVCLTMAHLIENCPFSFFRFQTCLDNSVSCLCFLLHMDFKWFLYLVLKSFAVTPMFVWCYCPLM